MGGRGLDWFGAACARTWVMDGDEDEILEWGRHLDGRILVGICEVSYSLR